MVDSVVGQASFSSINSAIVNSQKKDSIIPKKDTAKTTAQKITEAKKKLEEAKKKTEKDKKLAEQKTKEVNEKKELLRLRKKERHIFYYQYTKHLLGQFQSQK